MHRACPAAEVLTVPARAADRALLGFSRADLWERAPAAFPTDANAPR